MSAVAEPVTADPLSGARIRATAGALADPLPPLLAEARHLAAAIQLGAHGRRRAGAGDEFWQYRPATPQDEARHIDWRRSARSDQHFLRQREWQAAQSVHLWADRSASMNFRSLDALPAKGERARVLALATAILLERAGERIGLADDRAPPRAGAAQLTRLALVLAADETLPETAGQLVPGSLVAGSRALFLSDFFGDFTALAEVVHAAAGRGVVGALVQILDPAEEDFPFAGRTVFENMTGAQRHDTNEAAGLRQRYLDRLAARKDQLRALASAAGWAWTVHRTDAAAMQALLWVHGIIGGQG